MCHEGTDLSRYPRQADQRAAGVVAGKDGGAAMQTPDDDAAFDQLLEQAQVAIQRFVGGDAGPYRNLWSQRPDVTVFGGFGTVQQGWAAVSARLEWAAARALSPVGPVTVERLRQGRSGELAYTIWLERSARHVAGREEPAPVVLRVTHLFRREEAGWRIIHRHADPIIDTTEPTAVLQR
jgi:ketosteroid isomerase-like protein